MGWILPQPPVKLAAKVDGPLIPQLCLQNWDLPFLDHVDQPSFLKMAPGGLHSSCTQSSSNPARRRNSAVGSSWPSTITFCRVRDDVSACVRQRSVLTPSVPHESSQADRRPQHMHESAQCAFATIIKHQS